MAGTALIGLTVAKWLFGLNFLNASAALFKRTQAIDCVAMGVIIAAAATIRTLEQYETRHASPEPCQFPVVEDFCGLHRSPCRLRHGADAQRVCRCDSGNGLRS